MIVDVDMKIPLTTIARTTGIGEKTLERIIEQHKIDNDIKSFKSKYIPSDKYKTDKDVNLWQGDCLELMSHIPDKSIDMILCDLPYGHTQNNWDNIIPLDLIWKEYKRIIKPNGTILLTSSGMFTAELMLSNPKMFKYKIIWEKSKATNFLNAKKQPLRKYEEICVFYKKQATYNPQMSKGEAYNKGIRKNQLTGSYGDFQPVEVKSDGARYPTDIQQILYILKLQNLKEKFITLLKKPIKLLEYLIKTYTDEKMMVLDNTMGSGSTGMACKNLNRKFIGIELDKEYFRIAEERILNED